MSQTILINGIDSLLGARVAQVLSTHNDCTLIGLGRTIPAAPVGRADVLTAPLNAHQIIELLRAEHVDIVIHLAMQGEEQADYHRETALQHNVLASMQLLGACAAAGVKRVVVRSSSLVYGPLSSNPAFIREDRPTTVVSGSNLLRNYGELDQAVTSFARKHPELSIIVLRCAGLVGGAIPSPFTRYLTQPMPAMLPGFNPLIQMLHPDDAASAFVLAATSNIRGALNLAADAPLTLAQAIRLTGRQPAPLLTSLVGMFSVAGMNHTRPCEWPFKTQYLRYSCVVDTRRAHHELGWKPLHRAEHALHELRAGSPHSHEQVQSEYALRSFLERREKV